MRIYTFVEIDLNDIDLPALPGFGGSGIPIVLENHTIEFHIQTVAEFPTFTFGFDGTQPFLIFSFGQGLQDDATATLDIDGITDWPDGFQYQPDFWTGVPEDYDPSDWQVRFQLNTGVINPDWELDSSSVAFGTWVAINSLSPLPEMSWSAQSTPPQPVSNLQVRFDVRNLSAVIVATCIVNIDIIVDL